MKKILISIRPEWVTKILNGRKTIEVRKTAPKCKLPCEVYIYCTKGKETLAINPYGGYSLIPNKYHNEYFSGKVVAKFTLKKITPIGKDMFGYCPFTSEILDGEWLGENSCLTQDDLRRYLGDKTGYAWHIDSLAIFIKPKELWEFDNPNGFTPCAKCLLYKSFLKGECKGQHCNSLYKAPQSWCYCEDNI